MNKTELHKVLCDNLHTTYERKNSDYGDSFAKLREEYPQAILIRLGDKYNRLKSLMNGKARQVDDGRIEYTLLDLANYCLLEIIEINMDKDKKNKVDIITKQGLEITIRSNDLIASKENQIILYDKSKNGSYIILGEYKNEKRTKEVFEDMLRQYKTNKIVMPEE